MSDLQKRIERMEEKVADLLEEGLPRRMAALEDDRKWIIRTIGGSIILAIMTLILIGKKTGAM